MTLSSREGDEPPDWPNGQSCNRMVPIFQSVINTIAYTWAITAFISFSFNYILVSTMTAVDNKVVHKYIEIVWSHRAFSKGRDCSIPIGR